MKNIAARSDALSGFWILLVTGLGFFSDTFDAFLYNIMRVPSLTELGLTGNDLTQAGIIILNCQVVGALMGGFFFGLLGDRIGRKKALIASIILDSVGMMLNAFVDHVETYAAIRFLIGFGIAGEVGLGATLIAEHFTARKRIFALAIFTAFGLAGVAAAALAIEFSSWRTVTFAGGAFGMALCLLRGRILESALFSLQKTATSFWTPMKEIFSNAKNIARYAACVLVLVPNFFVTGFLMTLSAEMAKGMNIIEPIKANIVMLSYFVIAVIGDFGGSFLSYKLHSRRNALIIFMTGTAAIAIYFLYGLKAHGVRDFYVICGVFGIFNLWALASAVSVEQFPTRLRATVATSAVNMARAALVPMNLTFLWLKPQMGTLHAASAIGIVVIGAGMIAAYTMRETSQLEMKEIA